MNLSPFADAILRKAGWFPGRSVPIAHEDALVSEGYKLHDAAKKFLHSFEGIRFKPDKKILFFRIRSYADVAFGAWVFDRVVVKAYEQLRGPLVPLGEVNNEMLTFLMAEDDQWYMVFTETIAIEVSDEWRKGFDKSDPLAPMYHFAANTVEALEKLCRADLKAETIGVIKIPDEF